MHLKEVQKDEYKKRRDEIWPELKNLLEKSGVCEYSIFLDEKTNTLIGFQKVTGDGGSQYQGQTETVPEWWTFMASVMKRNSDGTPIAVPLPELLF